MATLVEIYKNAVQQYGGEEAVVYATGNDATRLTYTQLDQFSQLVGICARNCAGNAASPGLQELDIKLRK